MFEESVHADPADRPAATIWNHFLETRGVLFIIFLSAAIVLFIPALITVFLWIEQIAGELSPAASRVPVALQIAYLLFIQTALFAGLCGEFFGRTQLAWGIAIGVGALWLLEVAMLGYSYRGISTLGELVSAGNALIFVILFVTGLSIFFIHYLLWRTRYEESSSTESWKAGETS